MSKPTFYTFGGSVWAAVSELAILELGYPPDAIEKKTVHLVNGENFDPSFIKINPNATLPTLTADGKVYKNTVEVVEYLAQNAPKQPGKPSGTDFVHRIHEDDIDPNFALLLARNEEERKARAGGIVLGFLSNRQKALEEHSKKPEAAHLGEFYKKKLEGNGGLLAIYKGEVPEGAKQQFFQTSQQHWENLRNFIVKELPSYLPESGFVGGDRPGVDDFHLGGWLARIVATVGGSDISALEADNAVGQPIPEKVVTYWKTWSGRDSWKTVYAEGLH